MLSDKYKIFYDKIIATLPRERILTDPLYIRAYANDASFYALLPRVVIIIQSAKEVACIFEAAALLNLGMTFRASGTSLSGQSISNSILLVLGGGLSTFALASDASYVRLGVALLGGEVNARLAPYGKKIGPDPASIDAASIGGIVANNASGMCCGVAQNSYKTLRSIKVVLLDGTMLDTASPSSRASFEKSHAGLLSRLEAMHEEIVANKALHALIDRKYSMKNTSGYSINALADFSCPFDILAHLMVGSEGTLGFIEEVCYHCVDEAPYKASSLIFFPDIEAAALAISALKRAKDSGVISLAAAELMDRASLRSIEDKPNMPANIKGLDNEVAALLLESRAPTSALLDRQIADILLELAPFDTLSLPSFELDASICATFWNARKGMFPSVGANRPDMTSIIIEDVTFPIDSLASGIKRLKALFVKYGYENAIIFGHALEGNLHFVFSQGFMSLEALECYNDFMSDVVDLVGVEFHGSLKAEHGTGRNMASFVETEWGSEAYGYMVEIKRLFDPRGLLNASVIISDDKKEHLRHLKTIGLANPLIDKCTECGFCERICPSRDLTLTPRQRIVINRAIALLEKEGDLVEAENLKRLYKYHGLDTCVACGLCSTLCPIGINVGTLTKELRAEALSALELKRAHKVSIHLKATLRAVRLALYSAYVGKKIVGAKNMLRITTLLKRATKGKIALYTPYLPNATSIKIAFPQEKSTKKVVYFPSCLARTMGQSPNSAYKKTLYQTTLSLLAKADFEVIIPEGVDELCCGMPFSSKGFASEASAKAAALKTALLRASNNGAYPILCESSPCVKSMLASFGASFVEDLGGMGASQGIQVVQSKMDSMPKDANAAKESQSSIDLISDNAGAQKKAASLYIYEPIGFSLKYLVPNLVIKQSDKKIAIHATCSTSMLGLKTRLLELARLCSSDVVAPRGICCCGFGGDKGLSMPELNASALRGLREAVAGAKQGFSTSKTCEIGLARHSGIDYNSIFYLLDECSTPKY